MKALLARSITVAVLTGASIIGASAPASANHTITYIYSGDGDTLRAVFYEHANFTGKQIRYYGGSGCSSSTTDTDFSNGVMPAGWNDEISSVKDYNGCDVKLYTDGPFAGYTTGYVNYGTGGKYVGGAFNDKTSSFKVS